MIEIIRVDQDDVRTLGILFIANKLMSFTLEPPWRDNQIGESCIPAGTYSFIKYNSKTFNRECIGLKKVKGRNYIAIHPGNAPCHTRGCILPGMTLGEMGNRDCVLDSTMALNKILSKIVVDSGLLIIKDNYLRS